ncbi:MAG: ornithine cyclodeaminase family protein [Planctomycetota bacterium]
MRTRVLTADDLDTALPMRAAIDAMRDAFAALAAGTVIAPPRVHLVEADRTTLLMAASGAGGRIAKVVNIFPANAARGLTTTTGVVTVIDPDTGHTVGICDGGALTAIRTGAVAGLATELLADADASVGAVLGAGGQAWTQLLAMVCARPLQQVRVFARDRERLETFVAAARQRVDADVVAAASSDEVIDGADVVSVATSSTTPVLDGRRLLRGAHVNGVGSFRLAMRELDEHTIRRAGRIVVDLRASALHEAGELVAARDAGITRAEDWVELGALLAEPALGRADGHDVTVFKSVGHAVQDLFAARAAIDRAEALGVGQTIGLQQ